MRILSYLIIAALVCPYISHAMEEEISIYATSSQLENAAKNQSPTEVVNSLEQCFIGAQNELVANLTLSKIAKKYNSDYSEFLINLETLLHVPSFENRIGNEIKALQQLHRFDFWEDPRNIQVQSEIINHDKFFAALINAIEKNNTSAVLNIYLQLQGSDHHHEHSAFLALKDYALSLLQEKKIDNAHELIAFFHQDEYDNDEIKLQKNHLYDQIYTAKKRQIIANNNGVVPQIEVPAEEEQSEQDAPEVEQNVPEEQQQNNTNETTQSKTSHSILKKIINWTKRIAPFGAKQPDGQAEQKSSLMTKITSLFNVNSVYLRIRDIAVNVKSAIFSLLKR